MKKMETTWAKPLSPFQNIPNAGADLWAQFSRAS